MIGAIKKMDKKLVHNLKSYYLCTRFSQPMARNATCECYEKTLIIIINKTTNLSNYGRFDEDR